MRRRTLKSDIRAAIESPVMGWLISSALCLAIVGLTVAAVILAEHIIHP